MSASPFRTTTGPFIEVPVPVAPAFLSDAKKDLEDVPFEADIHEFPSAEGQDEIPAKLSRSNGWLHRLFAGRGERRLREEKLTAELQDLRASYAGLLHSAEDIRERLDLEQESRQSVTKALSPFPAAVAGIEKLQTRQEEASEILTTIRERLDSTSDRDETLLTTMDSVHGGVGQLQSEVGTIQTGVEQVSVAVSEVVQGQVAASTHLGDFGEKMETRFEEATELAKKNAERIEQSGDDVLLVLRQMERNSQRGLWIFACLLALLFFAMIAFSAKMSQLTAAAVVEPGIETSIVDESFVTAEPVAQILSDDLEF